VSSRDDAYAKAVLLVNTIRSELKMGTQHFVGDRLLKTDREILEELIKGQVQIVPMPHRVEYFRNYVAEFYKATERK
jgi:hypothetical protein